MTTQQIILAGLIFFASHLVSTVSGFGSNVLGLPLLALVVGFDAGKQSLVVLGGLLYVYMSLRWWKHVDKKELFWIVAVAGVGLVAGMLLIERIPQRMSINLLAVFVIGIGVRGLLKIAPHARTPLWIARLMLFLGGVVHGAFTTGGPLLTVYCRRTLPGKSAFRSTLSVMWMVLAIALCAGWTITRAWHPHTFRAAIVGLPFMLAGLIAGEIVHHRVDEKRFASVVNVTLIAVGVVLLITR